MTAMLKQHILLVDDEPQVLVALDDLLSERFTVTTASSAEMALDLVEREKDYVLAARTLGYSTTRIVLRHALPNVLRASVVFAMADIVLNILLLSSLSYLGLGAVPPSPEWGALVADGKDLILTAWWVATLTGLVIVLVGIAFSLIGDGLADRLGRDFTLTTGREDR